MESVLQVDNLTNSSTSI